MRRLFVLGLLILIFSADCCSQNKKDTTIYEIPEILPQFPRGDDSFQSFIAKNLIYPSIALEKEIQCNVNVSFIVEIDGTLSNIDIKGSKHISFKKEVYRLLKLMPKWIPGQLNGKLVRVSFDFPLNFTLGY